MMTEQENGDDDAQVDDVDEEDRRLGTDWPVFLARSVGLIVIGAMLATSIDASINQGLGWVDVLRISILPFSAGALIMVGAELMDRLGD